MVNCKSCNKGISDKYVDNIGIVPNTVYWFEYDKNRLYYFCNAACSNLFHNKHFSIIKELREDKCITMQQFLQSCV